MADIRRNELKIQSVISVCASFGGSLPTPSNNRNVQEYIKLVPNVSKYYLGIEDKDNDRTSLTYLNGKFHTA